jgi:small subunit ribosomal protein S17
MAEENDKTEDNGQGAEEAPEQEAPEAEAPEAEAPEEVPEQEAPAEEEAEAAEQVEATEAVEDAEPLSPKERRRLERSRAQGPPGPQRSPEERAAERDERRRRSAEQRVRHRRRLRDRRGEPRPGTPTAERAPGKRKVRLGTVVSSGGSKTITVRIERARRDPTYEKVVRRSSTVRAHDERNEASEGDVVRVAETRPLSRTKRWRLLEIVERAR